MRLQLLKVFITLIILLCQLNLNAQFEMTVRQLRTDAFGVFVKVQSGFQPSKRTITGTGQVTFITQKETIVKRIESFFGEWNNFDLVSAPIEDPNNNYISIGLTGGFDGIFYRENKEILLFTIMIDKKTLNERIRLIDNHKDSFALLPNSYGSNPGNELSAIDPLDNMKVYQYIGNYSSKRKIYSIEKRVEIYPIKTVSNKSSF